MAQVVDARVLHAGTSADAPPEWWQVAQARARQGVGDDPGVSLDGMGFTEKLEGRGVEIDAVGAGPGRTRRSTSSGRSTAHVLAAHCSRMISFSRQSVWTARRATRMTEGSAILFASISRRSAPIRRNSGALRKRSRFSSGYFWMSLRGLVPSWCRPQSPARLNTSRSPRGSGSPGSGDMAQVVVDLRHNDAGDPRDRQLAKCRQDEASDVAPILPGRAGLEPEGDVLPVEPRLASLRTVIALRPASRSASGSLPLRAAAMKAMARLSACAQVSTALFPKLIR